MIDKKYTSPAYLAGQGASAGGILLGRAIAERPDLFSAAIINVGGVDMLTREDPRRFRKSRDVGCYLGLRPGHRNSGQSEPQLHISKEGDPYLRTMIVQSAHHLLGPFGVDSDLRRWGLRLAERGGKNALAVARKLAILLHRLWVSDEAYEPVRNQRVLAAAA